MTDVTRNARATEQDLTLAQQCWGKAANIADDPLGWHPAIHHMLDVAAVALVLVRSALPRNLSDLLLCPNGSASLSVEQLCWFVALHDLGKLSPGFQAKVSPLASGLLKN